MRPRVSVYIPCFNYGRFLATAVESVQAQSFTDWELLIVDDGSTDHTSTVLSECTRDPRIWVHQNPEAQGLRRVANLCFEQARGDYILRLDADDCLHPRALELLLCEAEKSPNADMVFPDYYYVDERGTVTSVETLPTSEGRYEATSFPPHGAGCLVALRAIKDFGGLDETLVRQDGHEIWLQLLAAQATIRHVSLPLFYYRQHSNSLSSDRSALLADRAYIKRKLAKDRSAGARVLAVLTVCNTNPELPDIPFYRFRDSDLLSSALDEARLVHEVNDLVVSTDCLRVATYVNNRFPDVAVGLRPDYLRHHGAGMRDILVDLCEQFNLDGSSVLCVLSLHTPFRQARHVQDALDNFKLYDVDSVITVCEEQNLVYQMGPFGLQPMNPSRQYALRREREAVYVENAAVRVFGVGNLRYPQFLGQRIGHVLMDRRDGFKINSIQDAGMLSELDDGSGIERTSRV